ncbi:MFS transporter [Corynebacterium poyangense]|uniref:MFS transporter n=1 Tax=Corynebacterium poyangense TaxID=2684405 RepID=UPI001CD02726|nr:MFS transporter [Corynebacterium poyangense]
MTNVTKKIPPEIWVLISAAFIIALGYGLIAPIIPQFARSFDVSMAAASAVVSIFSFSRLVFAPLSGKLIDFLGTRKVYVTGLITVGTTTAGVSLVQHYGQIILLRGIAGIGSTMFTVSAMALIIRLAPTDIRGRCSSMYASAFLIGNIIGPLLGAALSGLGMRWPFFIYGVGVLCAALVVTLKMPRRIGAKPVTNTPQPPMRFREAFRDPAYRCALLSAFSTGWSNFGVRVAILPLFAAAIFRHDGAIAGLAMAAFALGNAVCLQFSGRLSDNIGRRPLLIAGLAMNALFSGVLGLAHHVWSVLLLSALSGAGSGIYNPAQQAVIADVVGADRSGGKVLANFQMAQDFGSILGPLVVGAIAEWVGFGWGFGICGMVSLFSLSCWIVGGRETLPALTQQSSCAGVSCRR